MNSYPGDPGSEPIRPPSRLAGAARSCARYMWTGLILSGRAGMFVWYPSATAVERDTAAGVPTPEFATAGAGWPAGG